MALHRLAFGMMLLAAIAASEPALASSSGVSIPEERKQLDRRIEQLENSSSRKDRQQAQELKKRRDQSREPGAITSQTVVKTIVWEDLVPVSYRRRFIELTRKYDDEVTKLKDDDPRGQALAEELRRQWENAPVEPSLNNQMVKLSGYLVTLEGDGKTVSEFLLVPTYGSCIHVPPPPANQIVLVRTGGNPYTPRRLFDVVSVTGRLKTELAHNALANASYVIEAIKVEALR
jgi:hypothetical protein